MDAYRSIKRICTLGARYPRQVARLRVGVGIWLLFLMAVLYSSGHGGQWAWLLAVGTAVHFVWAYCLFRIARRQDSDSHLRLQ
jgi:hypothetical protein